jgi:DNA-binding IclR family transcriptional regulator
VRVASRVGQHHPALNTAAGRVQMAFMKVLPYQSHPLRRVSDPRPTDLRKIERVLSKIREAGYAIDEATLDGDVTCIAAPVFGDDGLVTGAVSLHAPSFRANRQGALQDLISQTVAAADAISRTLGHALVRTSAAVGS